MADTLRYRALRKIADGGSAEVFLGEQLGAAGFRRDVVLKRIHPRLLATDAFRQMLLDEAHLAMSLTHPNLVQVLDVGESGGTAFLVLELVDGWTLAQVARRGHQAGLPLPPELACVIAAEVCRGLEYAHGRRRDGKPLDIVHRDVCPSNVLVSMHAEVKVADFGIARASSRADTTRSGMIRGKPTYMSPEQALGQPLDARSDLFSVGTVLFWMLTGELPFKGPSDHEALTQIITTDAPSPATVRPELPEALCRVVQKAMARDRAARFSSARELLTAIEQAQRTALRPAGRSELETWLRLLSAKDGETPISRQTMPPVPNATEAEWISLSAQEAIVDDQTATVKAVPTFSPPAPESRRGPVLLAVGALAVVAVAAALVLSDGPTPGGNDFPEPVTKEATPPHPALTPGETQPVVLTDEPGEGATRGDASVSEALPALEPEAEFVMADFDAGLAIEVEPEAPTPSPPDGRVSRSTGGPWQLSARLSPTQPAAPMVAVVVESAPPGLAVRVDQKTFGRTPVTLRFRQGLTYDVWFEGEGRAPLRQWLMLTQKADGSPRVTLRAPVDPP
jgi:serine/threonine-protein kinase